MSAGGAITVHLRTISAGVCCGAQGIYLAAWELFRRYAIMAGKLLKFFHGMGEDEKKFREGSDRG